MAKGLKGKSALSEGVSDLAGLDSITSLNLILGTSHSDLLIGTAGADHILGLGGNDIIFGLGGDDVLAGGKGLDILSGGAGRDTADYSDAATGVTVNLALGLALNDGDGSSDVLSSIENVTGSAHNDTIIGSNQANELAGGAGDDVLSGGKGADTYLHSGTHFDGNDTINAGDNGIDRVIFTTPDLYDLRYERHGNDLVIGTYLPGDSFQDGPFDGSLRIVNHYAGAAIAGVDIDTGSYNTTYGIDPDAAHLHFTTDLTNGLNNTDDTEVLLGSDSGETINANGGYYDIIFANGGDDVVHGGDGLDNIRGGTGNDQIFGDAGNDLVRGQDGDDLIDGGDGFDRLQGGLGNDTLLGGFDDDILDGGDGDDLVFGGPGADLLTGGAGVDTFQVSVLNHLVDNGDGSFSNDSPNIVDFNRDEDVLRFSDLVDINNDGLDLGDLGAQISDFSFDADNGIVGVNFVSGSTAFFYNQTAAISSVEDLVSNAATQIQLA